MKNMYLVIYKNMACPNTKSLMKLETNKKDAIKLAKSNDGKIRYMSLGLYNDGLRGCPGDICHGWDYPTFYAQSKELIY